MTKKIILGLVAVVVVVGGVAAMSAYEAHVINVTAKIENALSVVTDPIQFGTVFPQEKLYKNLIVQLSGSFLTADRVDDVEYVIKQKPKPRMPEDAVYCHENSPMDPSNPDDDYYNFCYPVLCEYLSKTPDDDVPNDTGLSAFHSMGRMAYGYLSKADNDQVDNWIIDLDVPCFEGQCAQDWDHQGWELPARLESEVFGCDLWIEVTGISLPGEINPEIRHISLENKTDQWQIISDDLTWGDIDYSHNDTSFNGVVTGQGLDPDSPYQITLNGPGGCTVTDHGLAGVGPNAFSSGYWNNGVNLESTCGAPGEGVYNMDLVTDWYTVMTDSNGDFTHNFDIALPAGSYSGVKVLVKKMLTPHASPWADTGIGYPMFNLYETAPISFTVL